MDSKSTPVVSVVARTRRACILTLYLSARFADNIHARRIAKLSDSANLANTRRRSLRNFVHAWSFLLPRAIFALSTERTRARAARNGAERSYRFQARLAVHLSRSFASCIFDAYLPLPSVPPWAHNRISNLGCTHTSARERARRIVGATGKRVAQTGSGSKRSNQFGKLDE